jgi:guanylate kinase
MTMSTRNRKPIQSLLIVLSAPSGGGKTTLCHQLLAANKNMARAVTCTTRPARAGEVDGVDYFFLEPGDFLKRVEAGHFLEHATVFGNSYGTLKAEVMSKLKQGNDVLLAVDVQGAATIRAKAETEKQIDEALVTVFLTPPSLSILEARLHKRGLDAPNVMKKRLSVARQEVMQWKHFDYLITSTSIEEDFRRMQAILEAEKMRQFRSIPPTLD